ncbi:phage virion morphogenesis protein (plasmid) [Halobacillus litoralis]|uniref:phage virion morphogenesis protein n=1 Tax=Halobacillus litoralis TaxID=45668 RepID=UPI001CFCE87D|nr:phage virion morphogenesis protein [Halobacillus litoralis]WLR49616.1 phage virion morphogenesis protein [Halobacillus litoralis]
MRFNYKVRGHKRIQKGIDVLRDALQDFREPLDEAGKYMHKSINDNFEANGRPVKWKKHAPLTKKLRGSDAQLLRDSGQLRASVTSKGKGSKYKLGSNKLVLGSNVKAQGSSRLLADIQQNGANIKVFGKGEGRIPPRPFLMIQSEDEVKIQKIFDDYVDKKL